METTINIRELYREMPRITKAVAKGQHFTVLRNAKPVFAIHPLKVQKKKKYTLEDFKSLQFTGNPDPNVSMDVDKILYS